MDRMYTSSLVLCRLFCEPAGEGMVLLRVPAGLDWLASRVAQDDCRPVLRGRWWVVVAHPEAVRASRGLEWLPDAPLRADAPGLAELLVRSVHSGGSSVRPLRRGEFEKLDRTLGHWGPEWRSHVPVEG